MRTLTIPEKRNRALRIAIQLLVVAGIIIGTLVIRFV